MRLGTFILTKVAVVLVVADLAVLFVAVRSNVLAESHHWRSCLRLFLIMKIMCYMTIFNTPDSEYITSPSASDDAFGRLPLRTRK